MFFVFQSANADPLIGSLRKSRAIVAPFLCGHSLHETPDGSTLLRPPRLGCVRVRTADRLIGSSANSSGVGPMTPPISLLRCRESEARIGGSQPPQPRTSPLGASEEDVAQDARLLAGRIEAPRREVPHRQGASLPVRPRRHCLPDRQAEPHNLAAKKPSPHRQRRRGL